MQKSMYKELSHSDTTMIQEVLTLTLDHQGITKLNNSKDFQNIEERSVMMRDLAVEQFQMVYPDLGGPVLT